MSLFDSPDAVNQFLSQLRGGAFGIFIDNFFNVATRFNFFNHHVHNFVGIIVPGCEMVFTTIFFEGYCKTW